MGFNKLHELLVAVGLVGLDGNELVQRVWNDYSELGDLDVLVKCLVCLFGPQRCDSFNALNLDLHVGYGRGFGHGVEFIHEECLLMLDFG